ncbi:16610_t:CDS:2, partial [Acaulospora colombiana]
MLILNQQVREYDTRLESLPRMSASSGPVNRVRPPILDAAKKRIFIASEGAHPLDIFTPAVSLNSVPNARWVYIDNEGTPSVFVFTDGAAPGNGQPGSRGGCGVVYSPLQPGISFPLEHAPDGGEPTSNRAELRAVLGAVEMRHWSGEGFGRLVIGTDSEYVVKGISKWCQKWRKNGWKTASGTHVKNQDLWTLLLEKVERLESQGFSVQFFQLKREWNEQADACAKKAACSLPNQGHLILDSAVLDIRDIQMYTKLLSNGYVVTFVVTGVAATIVIGTVPVVAGVAATVVTGAIAGD